MQKLQSNLYCPIRNESIFFYKICLNLMEKRNYSLFMIFLYCERLVEFLLYIAYFINPVILINKSINECTCREIMGERRVESIFCMYIGEINNNPMRSSCHLIITCFRDLERLVRSPNCLRIFPFSRLRQRADGGCNRSTEDALSSIACTDTTSIF